MYVLKQSKNHTRAWKSNCCLHGKKTWWKNHGLKYTSAIMPFHWKIAIIILDYWTLLIKHINVSKPGHFFDSRLIQEKFYWINVSSNILHLLSKSSTYKCDTFHLFSIRNDFTSCTLECFRAFWHISGICEAFFYYLSQFAVPQK